MAARPTKEIELSSQRNYRKFTAKQKLEIVLAGLRSDRSVRDVCREHEIAETLYYTWRDKLLEGGAKELAGRDERQAEKELQKRIRELERGCPSPRRTSNGGPPASSAPVGSLTSAKQVHEDRRNRHEQRIRPAGRIA